MGLLVIRIEGFVPESALFPKRCSTRVMSSGTGSGPRPSYTCRRLAKYIIAGHRYCHQHAGEECLEYLLIKQGGK